MIAAIVIAFFAIAIILIVGFGWMVMLMIALTPSPQALVRKAAKRAAREAEAQLPPFFE